MLIKGNFGQLDGLTQQIVATVGRVQDEIDTWGTTSGATQQDWLDNAGGEFTGVSQAWTQVSDAQQQMLDAIRNGVNSANSELQQALEASRARVATTSL